SRQIDVARCDRRRAPPELREGLLPDRRRDAAAVRGALPSWDLADLPDTACVPDSDGARERHGRGPLRRAPPGAAAPRRGAPLAGIRSVSAPARYAGGPL